MNIIAFDIDGTLNVSELDKGIISIDIVKEFVKSSNWKVGWCGNWTAVKDRLPEVDFCGPDGLIPFEENPMPRKLKQLKKEGMIKCDYKVLVGDAISDENAASGAGWDFIFPDEFKEVWKTILRLDIEEARQHIEWR